MVLVRDKPPWEAREDSRRSRRKKKKKEQGREEEREQGLAKRGPGAKAAKRRWQICVREGRSGQTAQQEKEEEERAKTRRKAGARGGQARSRREGC